MESTDRELLLDINGQVITLNVRQHNTEEKLDALENQMQTLTGEVSKLSHNLDITNARLEMLIWCVGIGFAVLAVIITFVGVFVPLWLNRKNKKDESPAPVQEAPRYSVNDFREIVEHFTLKDSMKN